MIDILAKRFSVTSNEMREILGVSVSVTCDTQWNNLVFDEKIQVFIDVMDMVFAWAETNRNALFWYKYCKLSAFDYKTPLILVREGHGEALKEYLRHMTLGGYA